MNSVSPCSGICSLNFLRMSLTISWSSLDTPYSTNLNCIIIINESTARCLNFYWNHQILLNFTKPTFCAVLKLSKIRCRISWLESCTFTTGRMTRQQLSKLTLLKSNCRTKWFSSISVISRSFSDSRTFLRFWSELVCCFSFLLMVLFQWFFMALSVRPGRNLLMRAQRLPKRLWASMMVISSSSVHLSFFILGSKWLWNLLSECIPLSTLLADPAW